MELEKKTPSTFEKKGNNTSQPRGGEAAMGADFEIVKIEQRTSGGGNANTGKGVSGGEQ